jgi:Spy/CpxP family protein refolding chaperone
MLKKSLIALLAAGVLSIAAPFALAQDNPPASSATTDQQAPPSQGKGDWHHDMPDPAQRTQELSKKLKLTSDQQTKVQEIFTSQKSQMESLRQDTSTPQPERHSKMMEIRKNTDTQIRAILDANQQKKWDEMQAKREQRMENHQGGQPHTGDQAPPQQ